MISLNLLLVVILLECFSNNLRSLDEDLKKGWLLYVLRSFHIYKFLCICLVRSVEREYDDLSLKSREAEKEVNMLQMKIQEVNNSLSKHHKDTECKRGV